MNSDVLLLGLFYENQKILYMGNHPYFGEQKPYSTGRSFCSGAGEKEMESTLIMAQVQQSQAQSYTLPLPECTNHLHDFSWSPIDRVCRYFLSTVEITDPVQPIKKDRSVRAPAVPIYGTSKAAVFTLRSNPSIVRMAAGKDARTS